MRRRVGPWLMAALGALLVALAILGAALAREAGPNVSLATVVILAGICGMVLTVMIAWLVAAAARRDVDSLGQKARAVLRGDKPTGEPEPGEVGDWLSLMAADAATGRQALARERALSSQVLDGMSQGVVAVDADRRISLINDTARTFLSLATAPLGVPLLDVVRVPGLVDLIDHSAQEQPAQAEVQLPAGTRVLARISRPLADGGRVLILEDVTEMRRLETVRRDFVANVSHELRTPVSVIRANAETLLGGAKDDPVMRDRLVEALHRNAERLALILADLLDLSRLDAGQYRVDLASVPLADAVAAALGAIELKARERKINVDVEVEEGLCVSADRKALDQVLVNLFDNAVKYTPIGGTVWLRASQVGRRVRVEVADNGPGIATSHQTRVFERFYRVDSGRAREAGGTGLGLAISKHLVESMGGEIGLTTNRPHGSRFWFELPGIEPASATATNVVARL